MFVANTNEDNCTVFWVFDVVPRLIMLLTI